MLMAELALNDWNQGEVEQHRERLKLDTLTNDQCLHLFRFGRDDLATLQATLRIPPLFVCRMNGTVATGEEGIHVYY